ncbi:MULTISPECIES: hypothetical protein [unclassified Shewanella]|uniref:hypothetical protein n=1 Tax=unclassified Shewanella TaxID=196818 RepID=UPI0020041A30|nr:MULTISPECIES: hypothetical protein [unclassified Shewanella]MCK7633027.1 hypothetical protein [Shewanella sp. JNE17]MCK7648374.1 hypothetical protein [Shewanella sp. JNE8]MCK7656468.1 hypothetical protein [Shewanella sp. JNE4-2]UPO32959.1 hypothetical protein MZ182_09110 [Shewanella sp. JNE2]
MSYELPNLVISAISALASVYQAAMDVTDRVSSVKKAEDRLDAPLKRGGKSLNVIDAALLNQYNKKIREQVTRHVDSLKRTPDPTLCQSIADEAQKNICFYLNEIKKHNKGELTTRQLINWWDSYRCDDVACQLSAKSKP